MFAVVLLRNISSHIVTIMCANVMSCENNLERQKEELQPEQLSGKRHISPQKNRGEGNISERPSLVFCEVKARKGRSTFRFVSLWYYNHIKKFVLIFMVYTSCLDYLERLKVCACLAY